MRGESNYDVIIVGAGPAGSSTAIRLRHSGLTVLLLEQKRFPREKLCGEFISPECIPLFDELGVLDRMKIEAADVERTVFYARNGKSVVVPSEWFGHSHALGLSRAEMDLILLERARTSGVDVVEEAFVTGLLIENERVCGVTIRDKGDARAPLTIDATGRARILAREIDKRRNRNRRTRADYVAFKAHLSNAAIENKDCEIYGFPGGYGGCVRVENGMHNLCFIVESEIARKYRSDAAAIVQNIVCANPRANAALQNVETSDDWLAVPIESYGPAELAPAEGLLTVGDAAGFIDPFTGSGMLLALESSKVLTSVLIPSLSRETNDFASLSSEYQRRYHAAFDRRLRTASLVRRAAFVPFLGETVVRILAFSTRLTRRLARATRQTAGPNTSSSFPQVP